MIGAIAAFSSSACAGSYADRDAATTAANARPPYDAAQLADVVYVSEAAIARDGSELAFVTDRTGRYELWTAGVAADGRVGAPVQRTRMNERVSGLAYSRGGTLIFGSDHGGDERTDLWILERGASEARRLTDTPLAEQEVAFSLDDSRIAYVADPDREFRFNVMVMDLATGRVAQVTHEPISVGSPVWRDASTLVAMVSPDWQRGELLVIDVHGAAVVKRIAPPRKDALLVPREFLPDGRLVCTCVNAGGFAQIALVDVDSGEVEFVGRTHCDVDGVAVARRSGRVLVAYNVRGESEVVTAGGINGRGAARLEGTWTISTRGVSGGFSIDDEGNRAVFVRRTSNRASEVVLVRPAEEAATVAVEPRAGSVDFAQLAVAAPRAVTSFDGREIDAYVCMPPHERLGSPPPAVVLVHGGPNDQFRGAFSPTVQALAEAGFVVIAPNYRGSTGYGREFEDLNNGDWGGGDLRDIVAVVDAFAKAGTIDRSRVGIAGASYGGYMTLRAISAAPEIFAAAVESYGMPDLAQDYTITEDRFGPWYETEMGGTPATRPELYRDRSPIHSLDRIRAPLLVLQGANDNNVPQVESDLVVESLRKYGRDVEYVVYPDEGHGFTRRENRLDAMTRTVAFFVKWIGGPGVTPDR